MAGKAEWRDFDWSTAQFPEREGDYESYRVLVTPWGEHLASIECFKSYPSVHYTNVYLPERIRGGPIGDQQAAEQWCEAKSGNKVN